jgi:Flp pilus assembly protein TadG
MRFWQKFCKAKDGASALEFALVFPIFASMFFGTVQIGFAYYEAGSMQYALERAARTRMVTTLSASQMQTTFDSELAKYTKKTATLSYSEATSGGVTMATLSTNYSHTFVVPFVSSFTVAFPVTTKVPVKY